MLLLGGVLMKILVLSHGNYGNGLLDSYSMIAGSIEEFESISLTDEGVTSFEQNVEKWIEKYIEDSNILILTDIKGGTPFNVAAKLQLKYFGKIEVIAGMNLPMFLELGLLKDSEKDYTIITKEAVEIGKQGIIRSDIGEEYINDELEF